jgi:hypothetical protein
MDGRGLTALGLAAGDVVTEAQLRNLFGERGRHPHADWRAITGAHLVPLVRAGARFENGRLVERPETMAA